MDHPTTVTDDHQALIACELLDGADPDVWAVLPMATLATQVVIAWHELERLRRHITPERLGYQLTRQLVALDCVHNTKHPAEVPR